MLVMAGGVFGARLLTALGYLVIAWFYSAEVFGAFSVYVAMSLLLQLVVLLGYDGAIAAEKEERCATQLVGISLMAGISMLASISAAVLIFPKEIAAFVGLHELTPALYFLPVAILLRTVQVLLIQWSIRGGRFADQALAHVVFAGVQTGGQAIAILLGSRSVLALVVVDLLALLASVALLARYEVAPIVRALRQHVTPMGMWETAFKWKDMPRFALLTKLIGGAWQQGPILIAAAALGGGALLGQVALALRALELVLQVINASLSNVALHHMMPARGGRRYEQFKQFARQLLLVGAAVYGISALVLFLTVPYLLKPVWADVPLLFLLLVPAYTLNVAVVPLWFVYTLARRLGQGLLLRLFYLLVLAVSWICAAVLGEFYLALILLCLGGVIAGVLVLINMYMVLKREAGNDTRRPLTGADGSNV